jgi:serine protease AprX
MGFLRHNQVSFHRAPAYDTIKYVPGHGLMQRVRTQIEAEFTESEEWMERPVTIAVLDTGIGRHPDLTGKLLCFRDFVNQRKIMYDNNGHGTHVCGILCGSGALSEGKYQGMAPGCRLAVGKVLDDHGDGMTEHMLEGLDWVLKIRKQYGVSVLNISVGIGNLNEPDKEYALKNKIEEVWASGIIVVCAAGNKGPQDGSISSVGGSDKVITVGCHDGIYCRGRVKCCETYSGRGTSDSSIRKPDIVAPGTDIMSCNVHYQSVHYQRPYSLYQMQARNIRNAYIAKSGTSMAAPIVSGAVALLRQKCPEMGNSLVKQKLIYTATDLRESWNKQGWGMINVKKLLE